MKILRSKDVTGERKGRGDLIDRTKRKTRGRKGGVNGGKASASL